MNLPSIGRPSFRDEHVAKELRGIRQQLTETNRLLAELLSSRSAPTTEAVVTAEVASIAGAAQPANARDARTGPTKAPGGGIRTSVLAAQVPKLHEEIVSVLREAGEPLKARVIADRIVERGRYVPPRSGHPVRGGQITARVNHPQYRRLFGRKNGRITLAE